VALPATPGNLSFRYLFAHGPSSSADSLKVWVEDETATRTLVWQKAGTSATVAAKWVRGWAALTPWAGQKVRIVIQATDGGNDSLVEVTIDDIRVERPS
jgi:hypothetical protein